MLHVCHFVITDYKKLRSIMGCLQWHICTRFHESFMWWKKAVWEISLRKVYLMWHFCHWGEQFIVFIFSVKQSKKCTGVRWILVDRVCHIEVGDADVQWMEAYSYSLWWCEKNAVELSMMWTLELCNPDWGAMEHGAWWKYSGEG